MIRLSDYLNYLFQEIVQARKQADQVSVQVAKEYAEDDYLKYFKVPRYSMPSLKMDIPVKIADIDEDNVYTLDIKPDQLQKEINDKIVTVNRIKDLNIDKLTKVQVKNYTQPIIHNLKTSDHEILRDRFIKLQKPEREEILKKLDPSIFRTQEKSSAKESKELENIVNNTVLDHYKLVDSNLNNLYIDPDTTSAEDEDRIFINLHVEMEEEGIRITELQDEDGNDIEQITFE